MFANTKLVLYNFWVTIVCATNVELNVYNMDICHKNNGLNLNIFKLIYLIYLHRLCILVLCTSSNMIKPNLIMAKLNQAKINHG
jgi:hypothetical protein